jgi:type I restriction enzyme S subunit
MSFPRYESYKDSGVEWLGKVPIHWGVKRLKSVLSEPLMYGANEAAEDDNPENPRFVRITDITDNGSLRDETFRSLPHDIAAPYLLIEGDVLLARSGATVGKSFIYHQDWGKCCFAGYLIRARLNDSKMLAPFLYACCQTSFYWQFINSSQIQATIQNMSAERYANFFLPAPPTKEQQTIAAFLDRETSKIDALITEQQRLIELLKEKRQAVISHAVTKGLNPEAPMKDSGIEWLGEVPAHWEMKRLRFVTKLNPSKSETAQLNRETEVSFLPMEAVGDDGSLNLDRTRPIGEVETGYTYFRENDVTIAKITPCFENGKGAVMRELSGGIGFGTTELIVVRPLPSETTSGYLHWLFISTPFRKLGEASMYGAGGQKRVPDDFVRNFAIAFPVVSEQKAIVTFLDRETTKLDTLITEARRGIELLKERRTALISAAVTGKIDVRGLVAVQAQTEAAA